MPRAFDVTASTPAVQLSPGREGEVSFTVSNALGLPSRVRAVVEPSGNTRREWLSLPGDMEKELPPDGTTAFTVKVAVPPGAPPGEYAFKLLVVSVSNPDEHYARGPAVAFTVAAAAPAPARKPFPWMWVALAAGVVLLVGGVGAFLLSRGDGDGTGGSGVLPGLTQPCAQGEPRCAEGLVCTGEQLCLGDTGFTCGDDDACASRRCVDGTCQQALGLGEACGRDGDCLEPLRCHEGFCLQPDRSSCASAAQCISGRCEDGLCVAAVSPGGRCRQDGDCQSPARCEGGSCRMPDGQPCGSDPECLSNRCVGGTCRARVAAGGFCEASADCEPPARCSRNRCLLALGVACERDNACQSGNCRRGICERGCSPACASGLSCVDGECRRVTIVPSLRACDNNTDCPSNQRCSGGRCRRLSGDACSTGSQCISGSCVSGRCR